MIAIRTSSSSLLLLLLSLHLLQVVDRIEDPTAAAVVVAVHASLSVGLRSCLGDRKCGSSFAA